MDLLTKRVDPIAAATTAFGDLRNPQGKSSPRHVHQSGFKTFGIKTPTEMDDSQSKAQPLAPAQADALRADFLAYNGRTKDARLLLNHVLQEDPNNTSDITRVKSNGAQAHHLCFLKTAMPATKKDCQSVVAWSK